MSGFAYRFSNIRQRARIHHIYYLLAAFDLAAVVAGLFLTHHVNGVLSNTVQANLAWSALHDKVADLRSGAGLVNAPGNDVFDSKDAERELKRFDEAVAAFWPRLTLLRQDVTQRVPGGASAPSHALDGLEASMQAMVRQTLTVLALYAKGDADAAGTEMAAMDRSYSDVLKQIESFAQIVRRIENAMGMAALQETENLQTLERALGFMILIMVIAVTIYGHKLGKLFQKQYDDLTSSSAKLKAQEQTLAAQNVVLDAALNNMAQGLAMFDAEQRLVVCNDRYTKLYGLTPDQVGPGTTLQQVLECRIANGHIVGRTAKDLLESMFRRVPYGKAAGHYTTELRDGRHIAVAVQPMADGGTVTTHQDITEQRRSEARIAYLAHHDALTELPNRVLFNEQLDQALGCVKPGESVAVHLLDLDLFKNVNDTLGHAAGDHLLKLVAQRLRPLVKETDTIARMGGDEFAILQVGVSAPEDSSTLARRVIEAVGAPYDIDDQQVIIGTSIGIAIGPGDGLNASQLLRNADLALYRAKGDGRSALRFFEFEMDTKMQERRAMERDLRQALVNGQIELHYQPVVNLASNQISAFEALMRWHHPEKGQIAPSVFIPLAEEIGFIVPLGEWAIRQACATAATWPDDIKVAVNLSPAQFRNPGLVQGVVGALAASRLTPERLELEITETVLLQNNETTLSMLHQLRALGVRIAMDDFGTGYSSLSYLQSFPFDRIKIDRSFVEDITECVGSINIVRAVAAMAKGLGMTTTAEGVETQEQRDSVMSEGCTEMQGYLFSKPLPADEIERLYLADRRRLNAATVASAA